MNEIPIGRKNGRFNAMIALVIVVIVVAGGMLFIAPRALPQDVQLGPKLEAESMSNEGAEVVIDANASGRKAVILDDEDDVYARVALEPASYNIVVRARADGDGIAALECFAKGASIGKKDIRGSYQYYYFTLDAKGGTETIKVAIAHLDDNELIELNAGSAKSTRLAVDYISVEKAQYNGVYDARSLARSGRAGLVKVGADGDGLILGMNAIEMNRGSCVEFHPVLAKDGLYALQFSAYVRDGKEARISILLDGSYVSEFVVNSTGISQCLYPFFATSGAHNVRLVFSGANGTNVRVYSVGTRMLREFRSYIGDLHAHSSYSDGAGTPAEAYAYAKSAARLDFFAITDHTILLDDNEYRKTIEEAQWQTNSWFVGLYGQEFGFYLSTREMNIIGEDALCNASFWKFGDTYRWLEHNDAIGGINHPILGEFGLMFDEPSESIRTIEILNGYYDKPLESAYLSALEKGFKVAPISGQDNHGRDWGMRKTGGKYYLSGLVADDLSYDSIMEALRGRSAYAFETNEQANRSHLFIAANGHILGDSFDVNGKVAISVSLYADGNEGDEFKKITLFRDGMPIFELENCGRALQYTFDDVPEHGAHYYFVKAVQRDGDTLWSSCIWVEQCA